MIDTSKIIHAPVGGGRYTVTSPIVKEDYGLYLKIEGLELPSTYEVDFSNSEHNGTSVTMIGNSDGVLIPRQFIDSGKDVFAFLYHVGDNYGRTVFKFRIPNKLRPDRTNEQPTPEEQSVIDQAINALNDAVAKTAQDVIDADASAQSASADADRAQESARTAGLYSDTAQTYANSAEISANSASASATASAQSASQSAQIKDDVEDLVDDAQASASASAQSATASANSASQASASATSSSQSASSAQGYASQAQTSAQTASAKASEASTSASTASAKATESAQSASQALTYKTDAESAKTASQTAQGLAESARDSAISAQESAEDARDEAQALVDGISGKVEQIDSNTERIESLEDDRYKPYAVDTASGAVASFVDGADGIPLKSLAVSIEPRQDGTGDPSPTNICPITGWTGMNLNRTDENLLGGIDFANAVKDSMPSASLDTTEKTVTFTGTTDGNLNKIISGGVKFKENTQYTFINIGTTGNIKNVRWVYTNGTTDGSSASKTGAYTSASGKTVRALVKIANSGNNTVLHYEDCGIFEGVLTVDDFKPYVGKIIPISWQTEAGTVYGGRLDVLTGILTVYPEYDSYNGETLTGRWISDRDVYAVGTTPTIGAQVVNIGAQGTEIQLEPHEVASLLGQNNIFADTGDSAVEYRADTTLYIQRLTEPDADMIADSNIVSGQYFMVSNSLYKATANIANGGQIVVGTNCTRVSLAQALNEINA